MEITKVVKPFIRRGANTFGHIVYLVQIFSNIHRTHNASALTLQETCQ